MEDIHNLAREIYARHRLRCIFLSANLDGATRAALSAYEQIAFLGKPAPGTQGGSRRLL
jgi:hypothetical protein